MTLLLRATVDSEGFHTEPADVAQVTANYRRLLSVLLRHGQFVWRSQEDKDAFLDALVDLHPSPRKLWMEALTKVPSSLAPDGRRLSPNECLDFESFQRSWSGLVELALLERERAELLGLRGDAPSVAFPDLDLELARRDLGADAECVRRIDTLTRADVPAGMSRSSIWTTYFDGVCRVSRRIVVLDRYAVTQVLRGGERSGLEWFLRMLDRAGGSLDVEIISSLKDVAATTARSQLSAFVDTLPMTCIGSIRFSLALDEDFVGAGHARHLRFDERFALVLDEGVRLLSHDSLPAPTPISVAEAGDARGRERLVARHVVAGASVVRRRDD